MEQEHIEDIMAEEEEISLFQHVVYVVESYGWLLMLMGLALIYFYKKLQPTINHYLKKKDEDEYAAKYHKNPDIVLQRLQAQEAHTRRLQEQYDKAAAEYKKKQEEKEAKKREEWIAKQSGESGRKLGALKNDYNPLMGDSSRGFRPSKKSACGGGGCGK